MAEFTLPLTATAAEIERACFLVQERCRKNVTDPSKLGRDARSLLDQAETCAWALGVELTALHPAGYVSGEISPDGGEITLVVIYQGDIQVRRGARPSYIRPSPGLSLTVRP